MMSLLMNFLNNIECDVLIQILPTSPFLTEKEITGFVNKMIDDALDTLVSVEHKQIACLYHGINLLILIILKKIRLPRQ